MEKKKKLENSSSFYIDSFFAFPPCDFDEFYYFH